MTDFQNIINQIAEQDGTTPEIVLREMQFAIDAAYDGRDAASQPFWACMQFQGARPTPEEFVHQVAKLLRPAAASSFPPPPWPARPAEARTAVISFAGKRSGL